MNVNTIEVKRDFALQKLAQYKALNAKQKTREDEKLQSMYQAVSKGARVINVVEAFRQTGLNEKFEPRLAIARADLKTVFFREALHRGSGAFKAREGDWRIRKGCGDFELPDDVFTRTNAGKSLKTRVPHIPPNLRPKIALSNFHILFEVENWEVYPIDPYLLRRIDGNLFLVVAEWELTELEAALLGSMTGN